MSEGIELTFGVVLQHNGDHIRIERRVLSHQKKESADENRLTLFNQCASVQMIAG